MVSLSNYLDVLDLDAIALPEDKYEECKYFYTLLTSENDRDKFRWLLSAYLGACYSFLEIKAKSLHFAFSDPETGEYYEDENSLEILRQYVRAFQDRKNPNFVKTSGLHELTKTLYKIRNDNTHHYALSIMRQGTNNPEQFLIGYKHGKGVPALSFCREILMLFEQINNEIDMGV